MPDHDKFDYGHKPHHAMDPYYNELIKIISILFVGVLATMTFLLTVGFQRPHAMFSYALYAAIVTLGLNLLAYVAGHMMAVAHHALKPDTSVKHEVKEDKDEDKKDSEDKAAGVAPVSAWEKSRRRLMVMRMVQQVLFVLAVLSVVWLALATAQFFFTLPTSQSGGVTPQ
jgi:hypothetical protein